MIWSSLFSKQWWQSGKFSLSTGSPDGDRFRRQCCRRWDGRRMSLGPVRPGSWLWPRTVPDWLECVCAATADAASDSHYAGCIKTLLCHHCVRAWLSSERIVSERRGLDIFSLKRRRKRRRERQLIPLTHVTVGKVLLNRRTLCMKTPHNSTCISHIYCLLYSLSQQEICWALPCHVADG